MKKIKLILSLMALGLTVGTAYAVPASFEEHGCMNCHSLYNDNIGPSFRTITKRYDDTFQSRKVLARSITRGSTGKYGPMPMPDYDVGDDLNGMIDFILRFK